MPERGNAVDAGAETPDDEAKGSATRKRRPWRKLIMSALAIGILLGVLWDASESHYRGCVEAAGLRHPVQQSYFAYYGPSGAPAKGGLLRAKGFSGVIDAKAATRAVNGCSHLPF